MNLTLFDVDVNGKVRAADPMTSVMAARSITGKTEARILAVMEKWDAEMDGGWTADELARDLDDIYKPTLVSAISRLVKHNLIEPIGITRPSDRNRESQVYRLKEGT